MKCPFCNIDMLHGYLHCDTAIWSERKHRISTKPDSKEKYALHLEAPMMYLNQIESDRCPKCKRFIMDTSDYENKLGEI